MQTNEQKEEQIGILEIYALCCKAMKKAVRLQKKYVLINNNFRFYFEPCNLCSNPYSLGIYAAYIIQTRHGLEFIHQPFEVGYIGDIQVDFAFEYTILTFERDGLHIYF